MFLDKFKIGIGFVVGCCQSSKFIFCGCVLLFVHYYLLHHQHCLCALLSCTCSWWYSFIVVAHVGGCGVFLVVTTCHCLGITLLLFIFLWFWSSSSWSFCCYSQQLLTIALLIVSSHGNTHNCLLNLIISWSQSSQLL